MHQQHTRDHGGRKTNYRQDGPETCTHKCLEHGNTRRYGIIKLLALVMHHMCTPEHRYFMRQPVIPIPDKIRTDQQGHPQQHTGLNIENSEMTIQVIIHKIKKPHRKCIQQALCNAYTQVGNRIIKLEISLAPFMCHQIFQPYERKEKGNCQCQVV